MNSDSGFTLVEVLVAFVIMSLTVLAGLQLFSGSLSRVAGIADALNRIERARDLIEMGAIGDGQQNEMRIVVGSPLAPPVSWANVEPQLVQVFEQTDGGGRIILETIQLRPR